MVPKKKKAAPKKVPPSPPVEYYKGNGLLFLEKMASKRKKAKPKKAINKKVPQKKPAPPVETKMSRIGVAEMTRLKIIMYFEDNPFVKDEDAMKEFKCSRATIARAKAWGRKHGTFEVAAKELVKRKITELSGMIDVLDEQINHVVKYNYKMSQQRKPGPGNPLAIAQLLKVRIDLLIRLGEFENIYRQKIDLTFGNLLKNWADRFDAIGKT